MESNFRDNGQFSRPSDRASYTLDGVRCPNGLPKLKGVEKRLNIFAALPSRNMYIDLSFLATTHSLGRRYLCYASNTQLLTNPRFLFPWRLLSFQYHALGGLFSESTTAVSPSTMQNLHVRPKRSFPSPLFFISFST